MNEEKQKMKSIERRISVLALVGLFLVSAFAVQVSAVSETPPPPICTAYLDTTTFYDAPSSATVSYDGATKANGVWADVTGSNGGGCSHTLVANSPGSGYTFNSWTFGTGGSGCDLIGNMYSASTTITATCSGTDSVTANWQSSASCTSVTLDFVTATQGPGTGGTINPSGVISGKPCVGELDNIIGTPNTGYDLIDYSVQSSPPGGTVGLTFGGGDVTTNATWNYQTQPTADIVIAANFRAFEFYQFIGLINSTWVTGEQSGCTTTPYTVQNCFSEQYLFYNASWDSNGLYTSLNAQPAYQVILQEALYKTGSTFYKSVQLCVNHRLNSGCGGLTSTTISSLPASWDMGKTGCINILTDQIINSGTVTFKADLGGACQVNGQDQILTATISSGSCWELPAPDNSEWLGCMGVMPLITAYLGGTNQTTFTAGKVWMGLETYWNYLGPDITIGPNNGLKSTAQSANVDYSHGGSITVGGGWPAIQALKGSTQHKSGQMYTRYG